LVLLLLASCAAAPASAASAERADPLAAADTAGLRAVLERAIDGYAGTVGVSLRVLQSGQAISIRAGEPFPSASLIKLPVLVALLAEVNAGNIGLHEPIAMLARDRVGGSGVLKHMRSGHLLSVEDAAWLMITISDNTATNLLLDKLDIRTVWDRMEALGLPRSKIHSKTFRRETSLAPDSSALYGLGVTTPDEIVQLLTLLHAGTAVSPALDALALEILRANQDGNMLVRGLPADVAVAHKSGSIERARNDCGIIYAPAGPLAICVMTRDNPDRSYAVDAEAHLLIARIGREVFRHFNPTVELPPTIW
jgi:beta-lactamase class A